MCASSSVFRRTLVLLFQWRSLLASMLAFGRLGVDSEVTALRAAGIGSLRMLRPTFIVFLGITALHLLLAEGLAPRANQIAMDATKTAVASVLTVGDSDDQDVLSYLQPACYISRIQKARREHLIYAQGSDGLNSLLTVTFVQMEEFQDEGATTGNPQSKLNTDISELTRTPLDFARLGVTKSFEDMTLWEAWSLWGLMKRIRNVKESRKLQVKIQQRLSIPFASIVLGLVGCLLSLHLPREQKRFGLALTLVIVFRHYIVSVFGSVIGQV